MRIDDLGWSVIIRRRWWIGVLCISAAVVATMALVHARPAAYASTASFVITPESANVEAAVSALNALVRGVEINATYAEIAESGRIRSDAEQMLPPTIDTSDVKVAAEPVIGTNVIAIHVEAPTPEAAAAMATAIGQATVDYEAASEGAFVLSALEEPGVPDEPVSSGLPEAIATAFLLGGAMGVALMVLAEFVSRALAGRRRAAETEDRAIDVAAFDIVDPMSGAYTERFLRMRLSEEISRSERTGEPFTVGVIRLELRLNIEGRHDIDPLEGHPELAQTIAAGLRPTLRDEDVLGHLGRGVFVVVLPGMRSSDAGVLPIFWQAAIVELVRATRGGDAVTLNPVTTVCEYRDHRFRGGRAAERVARRLAEDAARLHDADAHATPRVREPALPQVR